jgi:hypothetical protein
VTFSVTHQPTGKVSTALAPGACTPSTAEVHGFGRSAPRRPQLPCPYTLGPGPIAAGSCVYLHCLRDCSAKITLHWANLSWLLYRARGFCPPSSERCRAPSSSPRPSSTRSEPSVVSPTPLRTSVVPFGEHETAESPSMGFVVPPLPPAFTGASMRTQLQRIPQPRAALTRAPPSAERRASNACPAAYLHRACVALIVASPRPRPPGIIAHQALCRLNLQRLAPPAV